MGRNRNKCWNVFKNEIREAHFILSGKPPVRYMTLEPDIGRGHPVIGWGQAERSM